MQNTPRRMPASEACNPFPKISEVKPRNRVTPSSTRANLAPLVTDLQSAFSPTSHGLIPGRGTVARDEVLQATEIETAKVEEI